MKLRHLTLALALTGALTACDQTSVNNGANTTAAPAMPADESKVLATVNGKAITANMLALYQQHRQGRTPNSPPAQDAKVVLDEIISLELASQDGEKKGVDRKPEVHSQIEQQRRALIAASAFQEQMEANPITDEELKALYEEKTQGSGSEYKARHILVEEKETAETLIVELDKGADFAELAKEHSTGPSGKSGGDLGWFSPQTMVKEFSDAAKGMEKGSYSKEPVQTQFGWHIILLEDTRESTPPPFEQVKPQLEMMVRNQRVQDYLSGLREAADIQIMEAEVMPEAAPASEEAPADTATKADEPTPVETDNP